MSSTTTELTELYNAIPLYGFAAEWECCPPSDPGMAGSIYRIVDGGPKKILPGRIAETTRKEVAEFIARFDPDTCRKLISEIIELRIELIDYLWETVQYGGSWDECSKTWSSNALTGVQNAMFDLIKYGEAKEVGSTVGRMTSICSTH